MIKKLERAEDFDKILSADKKVLVDFNATWCGPCRIMGREIESLEEKFSEITFLKVDTDEFPEIAQQYGVISIPMMFAFRDGKKMMLKENGSAEEYLLGAKPEEQFRDILTDTFAD